VDDLPAEQKVSAGGQGQQISKATVRLFMTEWFGSWRFQAG
jgi:hypothetical protein